VWQPRALRNARMAHGVRLVQVGTTPLLMFVVRMASSSCSPRRQLSLAT